MELAGNPGKARLAEDNIYWTATICQTPLPNNNKKKTQEFKTSPCWRTPGIKKFKIFIYTLTVSLSNYPSLFFIHEWVVLSTLKSPHTLHFQLYLYSIKDMKKVNTLKKYLFQFFLENHINWLIFFYTFYPTL